jgi:hypothetical protein
VPVLLQGRLALGLRRWAPFLVDPVLARFSARMVTSSQRVERPHGNLFAPAQTLAGPPRATPMGVRLGLDVAVLGGLLGLVGWAGRGAVLRLAR